MPSSAYVWLCPASAPAALAVKVVWAEPSPQSTSTVHGLPVAASANEPRLKTVKAPSEVDWPAGAVTSGAGNVRSSSCNRDSDSGRAKRNLPARRRGLALRRRREMNDQKDRKERRATLSNLAVPGGCRGRRKRGTSSGGNR